MTRKSFETLVMVAVFAFLARGFAIRIADADLWGRMAVGKMFLARGEMPTTDPFAFTPTLPLWVDHEWLSGVVFYGVFAGLGLAGILILKTLLGLVAVGIAAWTSRNSQRLPTAAFIALTMPVVGFGMTPRAQIFTFALFALWLAILEAHRREGAARWLWVLPATMIPWANLHAGFLAGLGLLGIYTVGSIGERRFKILAPVLALSTLVTLINPYGFEYWMFLIRAVTMPRPGVEEWSAVPWTLAYWNFWLLAGVTVVAMGRLIRDKESLTPLMVLGVTLVLAVLHARHMPLLALAGIALIPPVLFARREPRPDASFPRLAGVVAAAIALVQVYGLYEDGPCTLLVSERPVSIEHALTFPVRSVASAAQSKLSGNLAVPFNWGEYALWNLPDCRVSLDGRYETVYPDSTVRMVDDFFAGRSRELLDDYPTDHVLAPADSPVNAVLAREAGWRLLATDDAATLWTRQAATVLTSDTIGKDAARGARPIEGRRTFGPGQNAAA